MKIYIICFLILLVNKSGFSQITNRRAGFWSDQTTWYNNIIPSDTANVILSYDIVVDINCACKSLNSNGHNIIINSGITFNILGEDIRDIDGNIYNVVSIGTQKWIAKNLNVSTYNNGEPIPEVQDPTAWENLTTGAWCYYNNNVDSGKTYGKLYNWYAVNDPRGLAPKGWHIPSNKEWDELFDNLGGESVAGGKMKEVGTSHWLSPNTGADNSSGFTGLPGGLFSGGPFNALSYFGFFWSSTENDAGHAPTRTLSCGSTDIGKSVASKYYGFSVRCVKD